MYTLKTLQYKCHPGNRVQCSFIGTLKRERLTLKEEGWENLPKTFTFLVGMKGQINV